MFNLQHQLQRTTDESVEERSIYKKSDQEKKTLEKKTNKQTKTTKKKHRDTTAIKP